jgi:hypothetical protein
MSRYGAIIKNPCQACGGPIYVAQRAKDFCSRECISKWKDAQFDDAFPQMVEDYQMGKSIREAAERAGFSYGRVRAQFIKRGAPIRSHKEISPLSAEKIGRAHRGRKRPPRSEEHCRKISLSKRGKGTGWSLKPIGYIAGTMGENKHRSQHVIIMEGIIQRRLLPGEVVHHKDGNRSNNDPSNLQLMTRAEHASYHRRERYWKTGPKPKTQVNPKIEQTELCLA